MSELLRIKPRRDTAANWALSTKILENNEMAIETDTGEIFLGDGQNEPADLTYLSQLAPNLLKSYTKALLPSASDYTTGVVFVTGEVGGDRPAYSDGTNWKWFSDDTTV